VATAASGVVGSLQDDWTLLGTQRYMLDAPVALLGYPFPLMRLSSAAGTVEVILPTMPFFE
jgi:hypothetical protein